jgi:DUF2075 family protein
VESDKDKEEVKDSASKLIANAFNLILDRGSRSSKII